MTISLTEFLSEVEERAKQLGHVMGSWEQVLSSATFESECERCGKTVHATAGSKGVYGPIESRTSGPAIRSRCDSHHSFELTSKESEVDKTASSFGHVLGVWKRVHSASSSKCIACSGGARIIADSKVEYEGELKEACPVDWREREEQFIKKADELASSGGHVLDWTRIRWSRWDEPYVIQGWCKSCKTVARMGRADGKVYSWPTSESCTVRIQDTQAVVAKQKRQEANEKSLTLSVVVGIGVVALVITALLVASEGAGMTLLFPFVVGAVIWLGFMLYGSLKGARETAGRYAKGPISFVILFVLFFLAILLVVLIISVLSPDLANSGAPIH